MVLLQTFQLPPNPPNTSKSGVTNKLLCTCRYLERHQPSWSGILVNLANPLSFIPYVFNISWKGVYWIL